MIISGTSTDTLFKQVKISVLKCTLGSECFSEARAIKEQINFAYYTKQPSLLEEELNVHYKEIEDSTLVKSIDPRVTQKTDIYFMNSEVSVKDNVMDIIDIDQNEYNMIEEHMRQDHYCVNQQEH